MSVFFKLFLICLVVIAAQGVGTSAHAKTIDLSTSDIWTLPQPSNAEMADAKKKLLNEVHSKRNEDHFIPGVAIYASSFSSDEANRLVRDGISIGRLSSRDYLDFEGGNILLNPEKNVLVGTPSGECHVGAGAIVFMVNSGEDLVIYDLLQTSPKQVYAIVNKQKIFMEPGRLLVLTNQNIEDFEKLAIDCHRVAYRNTQRLDTGSKSGKTKIFAADFSIASAMATVQPLKRLTLSKNPQDSLDVQRILKSAVLLDPFASSFEEAASETNTSANASVESGTIQVSANNNR
jgi:hypothetical protein